MKVVCTPLTRVYLPPSHHQSTHNLSDRKFDYSIPYKPVTTNRIRYASITFMKVSTKYDSFPKTIDLRSTCENPFNEKIIIERSATFRVNKIVSFVFDTRVRFYFLTVVYPETNKDQLYLADREGPCTFLVHESFGILSQ